ncbi:hypothetical protein JCM10449v2_000172 [Rhodotorula kratochvilovae]
MADPPAEAVSPQRLPQVPPAPPKDKKLFSIFAPRPSAAPAASTSTSTSSSARPAPPAPAALAPARSLARAMSASQVSAAGTETETLSLVDDDSDEEVVEGRAARGREAAGKGKGKTVGAKKGRGKARARVAPEEDEASDDDDEVVVVAGASGSRAGATSPKKGKGKAAAARPKKAKSKGKKRAPSPSPSASASIHTSASDTDDYAATASASSAPPTPRKRRATPSGAGGTQAQGRADVVDLTESPPRKKAKKGAKAEKGKGKAKEEVGTPGHAFSSERRTAREKAKRREAPEARWPSAEEHAGGAAPAPSDGDARGAWDARSARREEKGKARAVEPDTARGPDFLEQYAAALDFPAARAALDSRFPAASTSGTSGGAYPTLSRRPLGAVPFLLPPFAPHPLLDRLAAPLRAPASYASAFARPGDVARTPAEDDGKLWSARYAPQGAEEVLGEMSGQSARWLREWLEELKVQGDAEAKAGKRRRPVARGLIKKKKKAKKRKALDDFIASSDEDNDDAGVGGLPSSSYASYASDLDSDDLDDLLPSAPRRAGSVFPTLTNLILLHGPHGTGKSAAVHAVAQELGFEVFEVFAGMGRRGARDLERYVGDVGRNHVVLGGSPRKGMGNIAAMFGAQTKKTPAGDGAKVKGKAAADDEEGAAAKEKAPTQSLILVDEVDVLFKHEEDFWQGLIALAQQSRRPIVMTCTDYSRVPFADLGLQQIVPNPSTPPANFLSFAAPEPSLAVPYLQLVALREGHILPTANVTTLYSAFSRSRPYPAWLTAQQPGVRPLPHPLSSAPLPSDDLRKALMQLQVECGWGVGGRASANGWLEAGKEGETRWSEGTLRVPRDDGDVETPTAGLPAANGVGDAFERAARAADALSFADAHVARHIAVLIEDEDTGRFATPGDAEETCPVLEHNVREETQRFPFVGADPAMVDAIDSLAHAMWREALRFSEREDEELESKRADFIFQLGQLVHSGGERALLQWPDPLLPSAVVTTDYRPYLRAITLADDARLAASTMASASAADDGGPSEVHALGMAAALAAGPAGARKTRKSARQKAQQGKPMYERVLDWASEAEAQWLRESGFGEGGSA